MGAHEVTSFEEIERLGFDFGVECEECGRTTVFLVDAVRAYFEDRKLTLSLPLARHPFRCKCRSRHIRVIGVATSTRPETLPAQPIVLQPLYVWARRIGPG